VALATASAVALEGVTACKTSQKIVGRCATIRGRFFVANGTPAIRIWPIGTRRLLGVTDGQGDPEGQSTVPVNVKRLMGLDAFSRDIYGSYEVCPLTRQMPGHMQTVCIERASHLSVRDHPDHPN
jgi:hypothetical protein